MSAIAIEFGVASFLLGMATMLLIQSVFEALDGRRGDL